MLPTLVPVQAHHTVENAPDRTQLPLDLHHVKRKVLLSRYLLVPAYAYVRVSLLGAAANTFYFSRTTGEKRYRLSRNEHILISAT